jgi:ribosome biogenesis GTPase A
MGIQWFPGHMNKARNQIKEMMPQIDIIIEVLDARIPYSSENPMIEALREGKPVIKILNKADLADPHLTLYWTNYLEQKKGIKSLVFDQNKINDVTRITELCKKLLPRDRNKASSIQAMIMGIPNVGKSTIINALAQRKVAKTGNTPAVTQSQQRISLKGGIMLYDTPGMLWPNVENEHSGYRLAATGAIKSTAHDDEPVADYIVEYLLKNYPHYLKKRYNIDPLPEHSWQFMEQAAKKRACIRMGHQLDMHKMAVILLNELREGMIGAITLENPESCEKERIVVDVLREKKAQKIADKQDEKKQRRARARKNRR